MFAPKLLISGVGVIALWVTISSFLGGEIETNLEKTTNANNKESKKNRFFLGTIVDAKKDSIPNSIFSFEKQDYECYFTQADGTQAKMKLCKIFKSSGTTNNFQDWKISSLFLNDSNQLKSKNDIENDLKVFVEIESFDNENISISSNITVVKKSSEIKYFWITVNKKLLDEKSIKSNLFIANVASFNFDSSSDLSKLQCEIEGFDDLIDCKIHSFANNSSTTRTEFPFISLDLENIKHITSHSDIVQNKLILVELEGKELEDGFKIESINIFSKHEASSSNRKKASLKYKNSVINLFENETVKPQAIKYDYIVVNANAADDGKDDNSTFVESSSSVNNYKCEITKKNNLKTVDETCQLYEINKDINDEFVDLYKLEKEQAEMKRTSKPEATKQYILKIDSKKYAAINQTKEIKLLNKTDENKQFAKLTGNYKLNNLDNKFKTNIVLAKITNTSTFASNLTYKCKFNESDELERNCKVYGFSTDPTSLSDNNSINNEHIQELSSANIANNKYVLISFDDVDDKSNLKIEKELRTFIPVVYSLTSANPSEKTKYLETQYVDSYVGKFETTLTSSKLLKVKASPADFLIVVKNGVDSAQTINTEIQTGTGASLKNNYKCKATINTVEVSDEKCVLIPLLQESNKSIHIDTIKNSTTPINQKANFIVDKFFKLVVNSNLMISHSFADSDLITIESTASADSGKNYGKVKVVSKYLYEKTIGKAQWFLAKSKSDATDPSTWSSLKCQFTNESSSSLCNVYKITETLSDVNAYKNMNLTNINTEISAVADIATGKYVIIKFEDSNVKNIENLSNELNIKKSDETLINNYELVSPIFSTSNSALTPANSVILK